MVNDRAARAGINQRLNNLFLRHGLVGDTENRSLWLAKPDCDRKKRSAVCQKNLPLRLACEITAAEMNLLNALDLFDEKPLQSEFVISRL